MRALRTQTTARLTVPITVREWTASMDTSMRIYAAISSGGVLGKRIVISTVIFHGKSLKIAMTLKENISVPIYSRTKNGRENQLQ